MFNWCWLWPQVRLGFLELCIACRPWCEWACPIELWPLTFYHAPSIGSPVQSVNEVEDTSGMAGTVWLEERLLVLILWRWTCSIHRLCGPFVLLALSGFRWSVEISWSSLRNGIMRRVLATLFRSIECIKCTLLALAAADVNKINESYLLPHGCISCGLQGHLCSTTHLVSVRTITGLTSV